MNKLITAIVLLLSTTIGFAADRTLMDTSRVNDVLETMQQTLVMDTLSTYDIDEMMNHRNSFYSYPHQSDIVEEMRVSAFIKNFSRQVWEYNQIRYADQILEDVTQQITTELNEKLKSTIYWL